MSEIQRKGRASGVERSLMTERRYNWRGRRVQVLPRLVIQGAWFLNAGFEPGERVSLLVSQNLIIIKSANHGI